MKEMRERAVILENFYNNLAVTNVLSRDDVLSLEDALGSNIITSTKDIKTFSISKTYINVPAAKEIIKAEIARNKLASTVTQESIYDKSMDTIRKLNESFTYSLLKGSNKKESKERLLKFLRDDKYFLRYELHGEVEELVNIRTKGIFEVMVNYPEVVDEIAKLYSDPERVLDSIASIIENLNKDINNGENILDIDVSKLNFVSDNFMSNLMTRDHVEEGAWISPATATFFMDIDNVIKLIENMECGEERLDQLHNLIYNISVYNNKRKQSDLDRDNDFLDAIQGHFENPHFSALYRLLYVLLERE